MASIAESSTISNVLIWIDRVCDYAPGASTVTNLVDLFEKCVLNSCCCSDELINENRYFSHIQDKSILRCFILLVPILGNIIIGIYDLIPNQEAEEIREYQDILAPTVGLDPTQLPQSDSERARIMQKFATQKLNENLDSQIQEMRKFPEKFRKIIDNPQEPLEVTWPTHNGMTHLEKINKFWDSIKLWFTTQSLGECFLKVAGMDKDRLIRQKLREISSLKNELLQLRQTSYREYIQTLKKEDLLKEAKTYYLASFLTEEKQNISASVQQMTLQTILPKMKEKVLVEAEYAYRVIEMQEIISLVETK